jgi:hypothetical protein
MYIENPENPSRDEAEQLIFVKYLLKEKYVSRR